MDETPQSERNVEGGVHGSVAMDGDPDQPEWPPPVRRRLRRRADRKWVGGVAGGLADYWGIPAFVVRIVLVLAVLVSASVSWQILTGGYSLDTRGGVFVLIVASSFVASVAYLVLWLAVPRDDVLPSAVVRVGERLRSRRLTERYPNIRLIPSVLALAIGGAILAEWLGIWEPDLALAAALITLGVWLYRRDRDIRSETRVVQTRGDTKTDAGGGSVEAAAPRPDAPVIRERREGSPLGWITLGAALLVLCIAVIWSRLDGETSTTTLEVGPAVLGLQRATGFGRIATIPALGLIVLAAGLLVGSVFGRARWLIVPATLLVPVLFLTSVISRPLDGGVGDSYLQLGVPADGSGNEAVVRQRAFGSIYVDLNRLRGETNVTRTLLLSTVAGAITVVVPFDARVNVHAATGLGTLQLGRRSKDGVEIAETATLEPRFGDGATVILSAEVGLGNVNVLRYAPTKRQLRKLQQNERREERDRGGTGAAS